MSAHLHKYFPKFSLPGIHHTHEWDDNLQVMRCKPIKEAKRITKVHVLFLGIHFWKSLKHLELFRGGVDYCRIEDKPPVRKKELSAHDKITQEHNKQYDRIDPNAPDAFDRYMTLMHRTSLKHYQQCIKEGSKPSLSMELANGGKELFESAMAVRLGRLSDEFN